MHDTLTTHGLRKLRVRVKKKIPYFVNFEMQIDSYFNISEIIILQLTLLKLQA